MTARVPYQDSTAATIADQMLIAGIIAEVAASDAFILKDRVKEFEGRVRHLTGAAHAVATSSETAALILALAALGVGPGDDVLIPALASISQASAVLQREARPVFMDSDDKTGAIDSAQVEALLGPTTKVILFVHPFSYAVDVSTVVKSARRNGSQVIMDAPWLLETRLGEPYRFAGDLGVCSLSPATSIGGLGEAGVVIADTEELGLRCRMLRNHGRDGTRHSCHRLLGYNFRMDEIVAGYLSYRLRLLPGVLERRAELAALYDSRLARIEACVRIPSCSGRGHSAYVIRADRRNELKAYLWGRGIEGRIPVRKPLPLHSAFDGLGYRSGEFPNAESFCSNALALPLNATMDDCDVEAVAAAVAGFYGD